MERSVAVDRLFRATVNSWHGLRVAARSEAAVREELVLLVRRTACRSRRRRRVKEICPYRGDSFTHCRRVNQYSNRKAR